MEALRRDKKSRFQKSQQLTSGAVMVHFLATNPLSLWPLVTLKFGGFLFFGEAA